MPRTNTPATNWATTGNVFTTNAVDVGTVALIGTGTSPFASSLRDAPPVLDTRVLLLAMLLGLLAGLASGVGLCVAFNRARRARPADTARFPSHGI